MTFDIPDIVSMADVMSDLREAVRTSVLLRL